MVPAPWSALACERAGDPSRWAADACRGHVMRFSVIQFLAAGAVGAIILLSGAPAFAKTAKECDAGYPANDDAIKTTSQSKKAHVASCRASATAAPADAAAPPAAPASAAPAPTPAPVAAGGRPAKECGDEYAANKAAIKAGGQTKKAFVADKAAGDCTAKNEKLL